MPAWLLLALTWATAIGLLLRAWHVAKRRDRGQEHLARIRR